MTLSGCGSHGDSTSSARPRQTAPDGQDDMNATIDALIIQWQRCIEELQRLQDASEIAGRPVRGLMATLKGQKRALDKVTQKRLVESAPAISPAQYLGIKSHCWDDRWAVVKKCRGLVAINKDFPRSPRLPVAPDAGWLAYKDQPFQEKTVAVDAVVDSGATWIKFISISAKTLEYQVVAEGWASEPEDDEEEENREPADEGLGHTEFADTVNKLILAARWNHCHHVHLILPSLQEGKSESVDRMLKYIRHQIGGDDVSVEVSCADSPFLSDPAPSLNDDTITSLIQNRDPLISDDCGRLTDTVNLDPSALVALVTDLHHGPVPLQPAAQQAIIRQSILDHETDNSNELVPRQDILATVLYPALRGRRLVCTRFAAAYFRRLIGAIATHSEEVRASLILPPEADDDDDTVPPFTSPDPSPSALNHNSPYQPTQKEEEEAARLRRALQPWSTHPLPPDLYLPIRIAPDLTSLPDIDRLVGEGTLPPMASGVARALSPLNRSVYCYGWAAGVATVTGHRGIERQVRLAVARSWSRSQGGRNGDGGGGGIQGGGSWGRDERPPDVWHRHLGGYLIHRDKPKDWRAVMGISEGGEVPREVVRWTNPWTTWGRGISTYGLPDTKTWEGVGHEEKTGYGRRMDGREERAGGSNGSAGGRGGDSKEGEGDGDEDGDEQETVQQS